MSNFQELNAFTSTDFGLKKYSKKYFKNKAGYNIRHPLYAIKHKDVERIINSLTSIAEARAILADGTGSKTLRSEVNDFINYKVLNTSYQGDRHEKNLPVRGQRSKTNGRTSKNRVLSLAFLNPNAHEFEETSEFIEADETEEVKTITVSADEAEELYGPDFFDEDDEYVEFYEKEVVLDNEVVEAEIIKSEIIEPELIESEIIEPDVEFEVDKPDEVEEAVVATDIVEAEFTDKD